MRTDAAIISLLVGIASSYLVYVLIKNNGLIKSSTEDEHITTKDTNPFASVEKHFDEITNSVAMKLNESCISSNSIVKFSPTIKIPRKKTSKSLKSIIDKEEPVVLLNSFASDWKALSWDLWELSLTKWSVLENVLSLPKVNETSQKSKFWSNFTTFLVKAKDSLDDGSMLSSDDFLVTKAPKEMFFSDLLALNRSTVSFCSSDYFEIENLAMLKEDTNWEGFKVKDDKTIDKNINLNHIPPQLNLLEKCGSLQARNSEYHSMRVQLKGTSRYYLFPPNDTTSLHLFPSSHPAKSQSQINLYDKSLIESEFPDFKKAKIHETLLKPGQVLYVPPYWTLHWEALTLSLNIDVLSASHYQVLLLPAEKMKLPFTWDSPEERVVSTQVFLVHVLSRIEGINSIKKYSKSLYKTCYQSLYPSDGLYMKNNKFNCFLDESDTAESIISKLDKEKIIKYATFVADRVNTLHEVKYLKVAKSIKWVWLANYVDNLASWAMGGGAEKAALFLDQCLNMDTVLPVLVEGKGPIKIN